MVTFRQQLNSRKQLKLREDDSKLKEDALRFLEMLIGCCTALKCDMDVGLAVSDTFKAELLFRVVQNGVDTTGAILGSCAAVDLDLIKWEPHAKLSLLVFTS